MLKTKPDKKDEADNGRGAVSAQGTEMRRVGELGPESRELAGRT